jgi:hypothetical protein
VPAQALPARTGSAGTVPAATPAEANETTAGIPLRWPGSGWGGADRPETAESSLDSEPGQDDPVSDEAHPASRPGVVWVPRAREEPPAEIIRDDPGPAEDPWFTPPSGPAAGPAEPAADAPAAGPQEPGDATDQPAQPAKPPSTSFWDSVFGFSNPAGPDQAASAGPADEARTQPSGAREQQAEGQPATRPGEAAGTDEEPQFDRFRSSPTPPDDE